MDISTTFKEGIELARIVRDSGLNALHVSGQPSVRTFYSTPGSFVHCAEAIKRVSGLPAIAGGGIDIEIGERILKEGRADLVAMARSLIADPELPNKLGSGTVDEIRPCLSCNYCFDRASYHDEDSSARCMVNAAFGKEREYAISPASNIKKVVVVGGGPAGMEAARVAAERGHTVTLFEKASVLGGQMVLAAILPNKNGIEKFREYLQTQIVKAGVQVEMSKEVSLSLIEEMDPDVVILATGSNSSPLEIPGIDCDNVVTFEAVLTGKVTVGEKVVIIGGGGVGCEVADFLARKGKSVTVVEMLDMIMKEINPSIRGALLDILAFERVTLMTETTAKEITNRGLIITNKKGKRQSISADTMVLATGSHSNNELFQALKGKIPEVYIVGDCVKPRRIFESIDEGFRIGLTI